MIRVKTLDKPDLGHIQMNCDNIIHDKLTKISHDSRGI
jgi:hypothetical protein